MAMTKVTPAVSPLNQPVSTCCWHTCLKMLFNWKGKGSVDILKKMDESPRLYPYYMYENGISPGECKDTARQLGLGWAGDGEIDAGTLANALKTHGPYWVAGMWTKNYSHVIVVTACDPSTGGIKYINPWCNYDLSENTSGIDWLNKRGDMWKIDGSLMYWV